MDTIEQARERTIEYLEKALECAKSKDFRGAMLAINIVYDDTTIAGCLLVGETDDSECLQMLTGLLTTISTEKMRIRNNNLPN